MYIDKETRYRVNPDGPYKGFSKLDTPELRERVGLIEVPDPVPPEGYSEETHYRHETPDNAPPYVTWVPKSDEQLAELARSKVRDKIADLEASVTPRRLREALLLGDYSFIVKVDQDIDDLRKTL